MTNQSAMMEYLTTDTHTEVGLLKAQLEHMGGALDREICLCAKADAENKRLLSELKRLHEICGQQSTADLIAEIEASGSPAVSVND